MNIYTKFIIALSLIAVGSATQAATPNFDFYNKSKENICLTIFGKPGLKTVVRPKDHVSTTIDPAKQVYLSLSKTCDGGSILTKYLKVPSAKNDLQGTVYLSYDGKKIYPQTGKLKGLSGVTEFGYPNKNNIKVSDIE